MPTIQQLVRKGREVLVEKSKSPALDSCPRSIALCECIQPLRKNQILQIVKLQRCLFATFLLPPPERRTCFVRSMVRLAIFHLYPDSESDVPTTFSPDNPSSKPGTSTRSECFCRWSAVILCQIVAINVAPHNEFQLGIWCAAHVGTDPLPSGELISPLRRT